MCSVLVHCYIIIMMVKMKKNSERIIIIPPETYELCVACRVILFGKLVGLHAFALEQQVSECELCTQMSHVFSESVRSSREFLQ